MPAAELISSCEHSLEVRHSRFLCRAAPVASIESFDAGGVRIALRLPGDRAEALETALRDASHGRCRLRWLPLDGGRA